MKERLEKRSELYKEFDLGANKTARRFHIQPIHFLDGEKWEDIDTTLEERDGKFHPKKAGFDLDYPTDKSKLGFVRGGLQVDFIPRSESIEVETVNTGVRKIVVFDKKPESNEVVFDFICPTKAEIWYTDVSKVGKRDALREELSALHEKRLELEKDNRLPEARGLWEVQKEKEEDLRVCDLTQWDKASEVVFSGPMQIRMGEDTIYVRDPLVWDAAGELENIEIVLKKEGRKLLFVKRLRQGFLDEASYPVKTDATTSYYAGSGDGRIRNLGAAAASWSTVRSATTGTFADPTGTTGKMESSYFVATNRFDISRFFMPTDTSGITDTDTIDSATLYTYLTSSLDDDSTTIVAIETSQASTTTLATSDFDAVSFTSGGSITLASCSTSAYNGISLNATGLTWISKTGTSKIGVIIGLDQSNTSPSTGANSQNTYNTSTSENTGTSQDPYLEVVTTAVSSFTPKCSVF